MTWGLGLISEYRGSKRSDYARSRIELYERLAASTQDDGLRRELLVGKEKEIRAVADYLRLRGRRFRPEDNTDGNVGVVVFGRAGGTSMIASIVVSGALIMFAANAMGYAFGVRPGYVALGASALVSALLVRTLHTTSIAKIILLPVVGVLIFAVAFLLATMGTRLTQS